MELSDGGKSFPIGLAVLIQYRSVTATQPPSHPASHPASHVAVAITLNAQASSLKILATALICHTFFDAHYAVVAKPKLGVGQHALLQHRTNTAEKNGLSFNSVCQK